MRAKSGFTMASSQNFFNATVFLYSSMDSGPSFMPISLLVLKLWQSWFIRELARNSGIEYIPVRILSNIQRVKWVKDTKFGMGLSNP